MNVTLPVYVEERGGKGEDWRYVVRPLFLAEPCEQHVKLGRALAKLRRSLRQVLRRLAREQRQDALARATFAPDAAEELVTLQISLKRTHAKAKLLLVSFPALGSRVAFSPSLPELWFTVDRGQRLSARAEEVLSEYFRQEERDEGLTPSEVSLDRRAWLTTLELDVSLEQPAPKKPQGIFAVLGSAESMSGADELHRVGRCLDWLYPEDLHRAILREEDLGALSRALSSVARRPVLILGPRGVGKTALLHEHVFRGCRARKGKKNRRNVWLVSPQRLISGMSYVGQWEERVLAILAHARKHDHVIYFDDFLGLYQAGISASSELSVAGLLKPRVERGEVRVLAEMTPEAFAVVQERDRGFADMFHVVRLREPSEEENLRIQIRALRELEARHRCRFELEALPAVLELMRAYVRDVAFPGKAASFLERLAVKHRQAPIGRGLVLKAFQAKTGLSLGFLDQRSRLRRHEVLGALREDLVAQEPALEAVADVVLISRARLNDPNRPLATFLLLGPTGVGKTQCAKAVARYLFGDPERMLRFDMNEFVSPGAASRLVGTFGAPDGLLTSAIRRQPFAVVLLDEIEKAHPEVFDLLLQVLGEGRLSDARGRTADFSNAIVIMTSNLGVREAGGTVGFREDRSDTSAVYVQAAERFFRPEFFNRLDRVIPFAPLSRSHVARIARSVLEEVLERDGFVRRKCILEIHPRALDGVVEAGYHPQLGARALKRAVERQVTMPVAGRLAGLAIDTPTVVRILPGPQGPVVRVVALGNVAPSGDDGAEEALRTALESPAVIIRAAEAAAERLERTLEGQRPRGAIEIGSLTSAQRAYFAVREQGRRVRELARLMAVEGGDEEVRPGASMVLVQGSMRHHRTIKTRKYGHSGKPGWGELFSADDVQAYLEELAVDAARAPSAREERARELMREAGLLGAMARGSDPEAGALLCVRSSGVGDRGEVGWLNAGLTLALEGVTGLTVRPVARREAVEGLAALEVYGPHARELLRGEAGTHLFCPAHAAMTPVQVLVLPLEPGADAAARLDGLLAGRAAWIDSLAAGGGGEDPFAWGAVVRLYGSEGHSLDLATGQLTRGLPGVGHLRAWIQSRLPLPAELVER